MNAIGDGIGVEDLEKEVNSVISALKLPDISDSDMDSHSDYDSDFESDSDWAVTNDLIICNGQQTVNRVRIRTVKLQKLLLSKYLLLLTCECWK